MAELFHEHHRDKSPTPDIESMVASARKELRDDYFAAEVGISGANFLVAETGAICTITNEGNAELTTTPPRVHIVTAGIEKIVATTEQALQLTRLLVRAATGADFTQYTTFHCGPKRPGDLDGPDQFHIVLVDHGRTRMLIDMPEMLRCLRCGACLNHCVVYRAIGGHAYGGAYPGPMGSVLTPVFDGLAESRDLPQACTLNGQCREVCPVDIPLPTLLRGWREKSWRGEIEPTATRASLALWAFAAARPKLYHLGLAFALPLMRLFARGAAGFRGCRWRRDGRLGATCQSRHPAASWRNMRAGETANDGEKRHPPIAARDAPRRRLPERHCRRIRRLRRRDAENPAAAPRQ